LVRRSPLAGRWFLAVESEVHFLLISCEIVADEVVLQSVFSEFSTRFSSANHFTIDPYPSRTSF
jgi:hypothetical protein